MRRFNIIMISFVLTSIPWVGRSYALTLSEGLSIVASSGREVRLAEKRHVVAASSVPLARSRKLPHVGLTAGYTWLRYQPEAIFGSSLSPMGDKEFLTYGVSVNQLLYDFNRTDSGYEAARSGLLASEQSTRLSRNSAALQFILAYISLLESERMRHVAEEEVKQFEAHLGDARALHEEGVVTVNDVLRASLALADARQKDLAARDEMLLAASRVNLLLEKPLTDPVQAVEISAAPLPAALDLQTAWDTALKDRPELLVLRHSVNAKTSELDSRRAEHYPGIFLAGGYSFEENAYRVHEGNWSLSAGIKWDLYTGGSGDAQVSRTGAELEAIQIELSLASEAVKLEVRDSLLKLGSAREMTEVSRKAVQQARESLRLTRIRYEEGETTSTDVTDAVTLLTRAEQNHFRAVYGRQRAEARLLYAVGSDLVSVYSQ